MTHLSVSLQGTGGTAGQVRIGANSESVVISNAAKTTTISGSLVANSASVSGALGANSITSTGRIVASALSTTGAVTVASVTTSGALSVGGSARVVGSFMLGDGTNMFTLGRLPVTGVMNGRTSVIVGQAGAVGSVGGDLIVDAVRRLTVCMVDCFANLLCVFIVGHWSFIWCAAAW